MAQEKSETTPMMQQFLSLKRRHPEALLLFRCGDFYETYLDDAERASQILGLTLTHRNNKGRTTPVAMAGFPHHALDTYLPKLIRNGCRVAICDQLEDPKLTKKLVKRGITELVTPGVVVQDNVLNTRENNFLAALHFGRASCGIAFLDISTGEFLVDEGTSDYIEKLLDRFQPKEVVYERARRKDFQQHFGDRFCVFEMDDWLFTSQQAEPKLCQHFQVKTLKGFGVAHLTQGLIAAGVILHYLEYSQHTQLQHITRISRIEQHRYVHLDRFTINALELLVPLAEGGQSLLGILDRTATPMGGRLLRRWITFPLRDVREISLRHDAVETFFRQPPLALTLRDCLRGIGDIERIVAKVSTGRVNPREVVQLSNALRQMVTVKTACEESENGMLQTMAQSIDPCLSLCEEIEKALSNDAPLATNRGHIFRKGYNAALDELRSIAKGGRDYLFTIQQEEARRTGISALKVGYNNVFGYYLEVRNTSKDKVPATWVRKQTLAQAERYVTQELKEYEEKILGADEKSIALEEQLFATLVTAVQQCIAPLQLDANIIAQLDCFLAFAATAQEQRYIRPQVDDSYVLDIRGGRHPVIETRLPAGEKYVPNDLYMDNEQQQILLITGPNMAGKSALLRQTALIVLLAQIGSFVPAEAARIGVVDKIFSRVGASDNISMGESTFMVEMSEAANILNNATSHSLILFDELGRGTSTYDGMSLAWAIVEYLHESTSCRARTLFATHYHELNALEKHFPRIKNFNISVRAVDGQIIFLRKLESGGAAHSFGIHVAQLAGLPQSVLRRAEEVLAQLEEGEKARGTIAPSEPSAPLSAKKSELSFFQLDDPVLCQVRDEILATDVDTLTPLEALNKLNNIKRIITGNNDGKR